jgi:hypothetical protein
MTYIFVFIDNYFTVFDGDDDVELSETLMFI